MASSSAIAKRDIQLARARANQSSAVARTKAQAQASIDRMRGRMSSLRASSSTNAAMGLAAVGVGVIAGAQVARMTIFPNAMGQSRAPWINYIAGVAGAAAIISGRARSQETMGAACFGVGMALAQIGLKSFSEWDLVPGDTFGA